MSTTKPKVKNITTEPLESLIEKEAAKKISKKVSAVKSSKATDTKKVIKAAENDVKTSSKKRNAVKENVIRDSFSFPEQDYLKISELKKTCLAAGFHAKKSEILRAGLNLLTQLNLAELKQAIEQVEKIKIGRPNSSKN